MITLLDYGAGNVRSVINAIEKLGETVRVAQNSREILSAEKLVFPGVGNFGNMIHILNQKQYMDPLKIYLQSNRPFLGICLGLHALFEESEEAPGLKGLGVLKGKARRFRVKRSVPHIGWNGIRVKQPSILFNDLQGDEKFYFVHSYYVDPFDASVVMTTTDYGIEFVSGIQTGNILATQFHPEKSGPTGLTLLKNFIQKDRNAIIPRIQPGKTKLARRIVACLDVRSNDQGDLVVTKGDRYDVREDGAVRNLGKPVELAQRYYDEGADEVAFLNITGFRDFPLKDMPMLTVLKQTSRTVFVPLTIGGGIRDYTDKDGRRYSALAVAEEYFRSGADKISIGSDAVYIAETCLKTGEKTGESSIEQISKIYGNQAVVISIDPRRVYVPGPESVRHPVIQTGISGPKGENFCWFQCTVRGGREDRDLDAITLARVCESLGAGEILLNSIDRDGTGSGFDVELINAVSGAVDIPVIASSGAGSVEHFLEVFEETDVEAALAAGIFHRKEIPISQVKNFLTGKQEIRPCPAL